MFAFEALDGWRPRRVEPIGTRALVLRGFALPYVRSWLPCIEAVGAAAAFRQKITLHHGDVVVWGGEDRLRFHGVMPFKGEAHPLLGSQRINFTFRKAGEGVHPCN